MNKLTCQCGNSILIEDRDIEFMKMVGIKCKSCGKIIIDGQIEEAPLGPENQDSGLKILMENTDE